MKALSKSGILLSILAFVFCMVPLALAGEMADVEARGLVDKSRITVESFLADKDMAWFRDHMRDAKGLLIIPELLKGGFILGGSGGSAVFVVRDEKTGKWSEPAFYTMGSVTFGLQIGGEKAEVIMLVNTMKGIESLYSASVKLGAGASIAAGPVGAGAGAKANLNADFLTFARSKGAYAGISLEGAVIEIRDSWNKAYYGKEVRPVDILVTKKVSNKHSEALQAVLEKVTLKK
jgi:lipid-binding SYLF domain-containing protein